MQRNPIVLLASGTGAAIASALHSSGARTIPVENNPTRAAGSSPRGPRSRRGAPSLKRPRTPHDFAAIKRAEEKRRRKATKMRRDTGRAEHGAVIAFEAILLRSERTRVDARVRAEALAVAREMEAENAQ